MITHVLNADRAIGTIDGNSHLAKDSLDEPKIEEARHQPSSSQKGLSQTLRIRLVESG